MTNKQLKTKIKDIININEKRLKQTELDKNPVSYAYFTGYITALNNVLSDLQ